MLAEAADACFYAGRRAAHAGGGRARRELLPAGGRDEARVPRGAGRRHGARAGRARRRGGRRTLRRGVALLETRRELRRRSRACWPWVGSGPVCLREATGGARAGRPRPGARARARRPLGVLPFLLMPVARDHATGDRWPAAEAEYHEAIRLARETGQRTDLAILLAGLAVARGAAGPRGGLPGARRARRGRSRPRSASGMHEVWALRGARHAGARARHAPAAAVARWRSSTPCCASAASATPTCRRRRTSSTPTCGSAGATTRPRVAAAFEAAGAGQGPAVGAGVRGALPRPAGGRRRARRALRRGARAARPDAGRLRGGPHPAGLRRTAAPRPAARPTPASRCARRSTASSALGAAPWAEPARTELAATGETAAPARPVARATTLTPQELQIALLLADGRRPARRRRRSSSARRRSSTTCATSTTSSACARARSSPRRWRQNVERAGTRPAVQCI